MPLFQQPSDVCIHRFPGDDIPIVRGSALAALNGDKPDIGHDAIVALMKAVDDYIPDPQRALDKPFSMPVEDVFSIQVGGASLMPPSPLGRSPAIWQPCARPNLTTRYV